ncbi:MAG TPA: CHAT domain-containing protein [Thermoanaerobaculia bacterium]
MSPERWRQVKELLDGALDVPGKEREAWLARACGDDDELRRELRGLLAFEGAGAAFLERPACSLLAPEPEALEPGQRVGPYRILRPLARGGDGAVYLALREDAFVKKVALKLLRPGRSCREIVRRFERERQILAEMEHPGIARLLDGGSTADGRPYFVMEHVVGEPIDRYCGRRRLAVDARLRIFLEVGAAVAFAHRRHVVHGDLKPGNVLVTPEGEAKLLDFGVAEVLDPREERPADAARAMTPAYASPEQARGEAATRASDVYSLGVLLWELLTGRRLPAGPAPPPSSAAAGARRRLRGDVDAVVLKALAPGPERRYATAAELCDDLERHLAARPVLARPGSAAYRAGRFLRRRRSLLAAAVLAAALLGSAWHGRRLVRELADSLAVHGETTGVLAAVAAGLEGEDAAARIDRAAAEIEARLATRPRLRAALLDSIAAVSRGLERTAPGIVIESVGAGSALDKAGLEPGDAVRWWRRPGAHDARGVLRSPYDWEWLASEQAPRGAVELVGPDRTWTVAPGPWDAAARPALAGERLELYAQGLERLRAEDAEGAMESWRLLASLLGERGEPRSWILLRLGDAAGDAGRRDEAREAYQAALEAAQRPAARAVVLRALGMFAEGHGDFAGAEARYREACELLAHPPGSLVLAECLNDLAAVAWSRGDVERAAQWFRQALEIRRSQVPGSLEEAASLNNLGVVALLRGELAAAAELHRRAFDVYRELDPGGLKVAISLNNLGNVAWSRGEIDLAAAYHRRALDIREERSPGGLEVAESLNNLGSVVLSRGDPDLAAAYQRQALEIYERAAPESPRVAASLNNLGNVARERGAWGRATAFYQRARAIYEELSPGSPDVADSLLNLGMVARERGEWELAAEHLRRALDLYEAHAPGGLLAALASTQLGSVARARGEAESAAAHLRRAVEVTATLAPGSLFESEALQALGELHRSEGRPRLALEAFERAVAALESQVDKLGGSQDSHGRFLGRRRGAYDQAIDLRLELGDAAAAFHLVERSRAQSFLALLATRDLVPEDLPADLERRRRRLGLDYDHLLERLGDLSPRRDAGEIGRLRDEMALVRARQEEVRSLLRQASPRLAAARDPRPLTWREARAALGPGTAMLLYAVGPERTHLFVVRPGSELLTATVPRGEEALRGEVAAFRDAIAAAAQGAVGTARSFRDLGAHLYATLIAPAEDALADAERILLVPDGPLHLLPFRALGHFTGGGYRYLVEWKPIHSALSATVYAELTGSRGRPHGSRPRDSRPALAAFGDPVYPGEASPGPAATAAALRLRSVTERRGGWSPLPSTRREVQGVAALYPEDLTEVYLGAAATEERVKAVSERDPRTLHFATHGFVDDRSPLDSGLVLSVPERLAEDRDNGLLQSWEVLESLRLDADLVVLSGCETGRGEIRGGEGLIGLTRAFQIAGARSVVATSWQVEDAVTAELMIRFHRHLRSGKPKDEALRAAQLELIRGPIRVDDGGGGRVEKDASTPYFWAAFELTGDHR